ncbi:MAG: diguanylate cyclase [Syntrophales bacterium]|nr:diguanylate cyclase [Syntrophales bacterium]
MNIDTIKKHAFLILFVALLLAIYFATYRNYLLFHSIAEIFSIVIACCIFILAWNTKNFISNNYLLFLGIAYLFVGIIDFVHTLAYKGMNIFVGYDANLPTQLWIAARYTESISLLIAPIFVDKRINLTVTLVIFFIFCSFLLASIFYWDIFPDCFIEGKGLTTFKIASEYVISIILCGAIVTLLRIRERFDPVILRYLLAAIGFTIAAELAFTFYVHVYGLSNMIGHYFKIISFYFVYKAIFETGVSNPYSLLLKDLKERQDQLKDAHILARLGHWSWDLKTDKRTWSEETFHIFGIPREKGEPSWEGIKAMIHPDDLPLFLSTIEDARNRGVSYEMDFRIIRPDREHRWIHALGHVKKNEENKVVGLFGTIQDITHRKRLEESVNTERKRFLNLIENLPFALILMDKKGNFLYVNPRFTEIFGYDLGDVPDEKHWFEKAFPNPSYRQEVEKAWLENFKKPGLWQRKALTYKTRCKNGELKFINFEAVELPSEQVMVTCQDVTEQKLLEKKLEDISITDELTGILNRRGFTTLAQQQLKIAERTKKPMLLFFIDLDKMKEINDTLGHQKGDEALRETSAILKKTFRKSDIIGRIGGDEFAVLVLNAGEKEKFLFETRLSEIIRLRNASTQKDYQLSFSMGCAVYDPDNPQNLDSLMSKADTLMYQAKRGSDLKKLQN